MSKSNESIELRLLATSDLHAHLMNFNYYRDEYVEQYGLISLATLIDKARSEVQNSLLFDNGDLIQGNPMGDYMLEYASQYEHPAMILMNELEYDVATLGNHEFNFGIPFLETVIMQADFPYVNANIETKDAKKFLSPFVILEREYLSSLGKYHILKVGIIGVLPPQILTWDKHYFDEYNKLNDPLEVRDIVKTVEYYIPKMKAAGADIIIVLSHSGYSIKPYEEGAENSSYYLTQLDGIDAMITGHQHRRFPSDDYLDGRAYGFDLDNGKVNNIPSVMAGSWAKFLGQIDLKLIMIDDEWRVDQSKAQLRDIREIEKGHPISLRLNAKMAHAHSYLRQKMNSAVGETKTEYYSYLSLIQDDTCVQIVSDAQYYFAKKILVNHLEYRDLPLLSAVPLFKVGGRKDDSSYFTEISVGSIAFKDIADLYVYPNQLVILKISGKNLKEWLECCASIYHTIDPYETKPQFLINWQEYRPYNFDVIKGIEYEIDPTQPPRYDGELNKINDTAERICTLSYDGKKIQDTDEFLLATNSYRALVDRFPGAGVEHSIAVTTQEIPDVIFKFIQHEINRKGYLETIYDDNWKLNLKDIKDAQLLIETSNNIYAEKYLHKNAKYRMTFSYQDAEGFMVYQFGKEPYAE